MCAVCLCAVCFVLCTLYRVPCTCTYRVPCGFTAEVIEIRIIKNLAMGRSQKLNTLETLDSTPTPTAPTTHVQGTRSRESKIQKYNVSM